MSGEERSEGWRSPGETGSNAKLASDGSRGQRSGMVAETAPAPALQGTPRTPSRARGTDGPALLRLAAVKAITEEGLSKAEAQRRFGLNKNALTPKVLEPLVEKSPLFSHLREAGDIWSVTVAAKDGSHGRVSFRQGACKMVECAVDEVIELGGKLKTLTSAQRSRLREARQCLSWVNQLGLWKDSHSSAPSELAATMPAEQDRMSAETVLADHPPEAESLTIQSDPEGDSPGVPA